LAITRSADFVSLAFRLLLDEFSHSGLPLVAAVLDAVVSLGLDAENGVDDRILALPIRREPPSKAPARKARFVDVIGRSLTRLRR